MKGDRETMKGDFSRGDAINEPNLNGVLHQQGRVFLDRDWNDQTQIALDWQDGAAKQIIGSNVAAISTQEPNAFKVIHANAKTGKVQLEIHPGQGWADGLAVTLPGESNVTHTATYLEPPIQDPSGKVSDIKNGIRDAVILEVWREALNGFQMPEILIEPALGGPDTTERVLTSMRFRLFRLAAGQDCHNIIDKLQDDVSKKGKLTVSLQDTAETGGDCPVVEGGGYTGFEHQLYRIEIAQVNEGTAWFKWSQFNGGLVGRGKYEVSGDKKRITLTANDQAIKMSGLTGFYLEVINLDEEQGFWRVTYGAEVTLNGDNLEVANERYAEPILPSGKVFFRLWNGISAIALFPKATEPSEPQELRDGIRLEFDNPDTTYYRPGDYWTFKVRAGEISNPPILLDDQHPEGINYHRVPLAELNWNAGLDISFDDEQIEDCRDIFRPLTQQQGCCTFSVGDGKTSHGDFDSIEEALRHLPKLGGKICLLPGLHEANVLIKEKRNIKIEGCGKHTRVIPRKKNRTSSIFHIIDSECIALLDIDLVTLGGTAIVLEATEVGNLREIEIGHNRMIAYKEAIHVKRGLGIHIHHNKIRMLDKEGAGVAMYLMAEDSLVERNDIGVIPAENTPPPQKPDGGETPNPTDPCADLEILYISIPAFLAYINLIWTVVLLFIPTNPFKALGGIQIAGGSERVKVWENTINGGAGNGIALGTSLAVFLEELEESPEEEEQSIEHSGGKLWGRVVSGETRLPNITVLFESQDQDGTTFSTITDNNGDCVTEKIASGKYTVSIITPGYKIDRISFQENGREFGFHQIEVVPEEIDLGDLLAFIYEIEIHRNEISHMGLSGIGIPRVELPDSLPKNVARHLIKFTRFLAVFGNPIIGLEIHENHIFTCFQNRIEGVLRTEIQVRGFGGISLGICANLAIARNRIESNGTSHINPVCGIFVTYGEQMDINHNWIAENGPLTNATGSLIPGKRGGIVLAASSFPLLSFLSTALSATKSIVGVANTSALMGRLAARVHDNIVNQPAGQALTILAIGSVSIVNNHFNSELSGTEFFDLLAGGVMIVNLGGLNRLGTPGIGGAIPSVGAISGAKTNYTSFSRNPSADLLFPNGNTLFNNNQTRVGIQNTSLTSQWIFSVDDIGFDGNQSDDLGGRRLSERVIIFAVNTVLWATSLRASDSRLKEIIDVDKPTVVRFSLITLSTLMNNTTNNQGDHCIFAFNAFAVASPASVFEGNQVLDATFCRPVIPQ
ncbi:DUF6519 domain-containing protein [Microcoleus sp. OTE_8_concoct_300]|uniref:DUF6519 domain-containing protein n=1 Tax=Microcoleus sp. OTE_8_concoct_300 TaxID=2964710 RepID=UPI00403F8206